MATSKKLGDYIEKWHVKKSEWQGKESLEVLGVSNTDGITKTSHIKSKDLSNYLVIEPNTFAYNPYRVNVGSIGLTPKDTFGLVSPAYTVFKVKKDKLIPELLLEYLKSFSGLQQINKYARGTVRKALRYDDLCEIEVSFPSYEEQKFIFAQKKLVEIKNEKLKNEIKKQKNLVSQLKQSILQEAIQGKLTEDWRKQNPTIEPGSELLKRIKAKKAQLIKDKKIKKEKPLPLIIEKDILFDLPHGWVWCRLGDICNNITSGSTPSKDSFIGGTIPYLKVYNIRGQKIDFEYKPQFIKEEVHNSQLKRCILKSGDVVMNIVGPPLGKVAIIPNDYEEWNCNQAISIFRCLDKKINPFIYKYLCAGLYLNYLHYKGMAGQDNISVTMCKELVMGLPPLEEQKAIVEKVEALMQKCKDLEQEIEKSETNAEMLMQAVLKEAFESKEIKVIELPKLQELESSHFPKRKMLASYIINQSVNDKQFGDTKFEKLLHLADYHILKRNFGQEYKQKAAGPYDNKFTVPFFNQTIKAGWFYKQSLGQMNRILPAKNNSKSQTTYDYFSDEELEKINSLINTFKNFAYKIPEIISTLYAVWNNRIIKKQEINNDLLKQDFLNWDKGKAQYVYPKDRVTPAIKWMEENGFIPDGWGKIIEPPKSKNIE